MQNTALWTLTEVSLMLELLTFLSAIITVAIILESTPESVQ